MQLGMRIDAEDYLLALVFGLIHRHRSPPLLSFAQLHDGALAELFLDLQHDVLDRSALVWLSHEVSLLPRAPRGCRLD
jgi:hypothetical protein